MPDLEFPIEPTTLRQRALARWDNEGGAIAAGANLPAHVPDMSNAELAQLRIRVIALENLVIGIIAAGLDAQVQVVRDMAGYISPRPGATNHPLTVSAAHHMTDLVERAIHFRTVEQK